MENAILIYEILLEALNEVTIEGENLIYRGKEVNSIYKLINILPISSDNRKLLTFYFDNENRKRFENHDFDFGILMFLNIENSLKSRINFCKLQIEKFKNFHINKLTRKL